jgi:ribonuclease PH
VDPSGYATGLLKDAIGYTGSPVAFIQLIAAMDRDGELEREIRGKRTYSITGLGAAPMASVMTAQPAGAAVASIPVAGQPTIELDYKKLAQALVTELLAATASANEVARGGAAADVLPAERDEYARRLELARRHLDELLGQPIAANAQ